MLNGLDLFSGIGGLSLALGEWVGPIAYCENDRYAQAVLLSRMRAGELCRAPIWDDVRTLRGKQLPRIDIIYGGFPCQDISVAGARAGLDGKSSSLFYEVVRLAREISPSFIFLENTAKGMARHQGRIIECLTGIGFRVLPPLTISARNVGAHHERLRWFLLAYSNRLELRISEGRRSWSSGENPQEYFSPSWWAREPGVSGVAHGIPARMDRLRGLGNAVVPLQAREAFKKLMGIGE